MEKDKFALQIENNYRIFKKDAVDSPHQDIHVVIIPGTCWKVVNRTGNPGLVEFYEPFIEQLHANLEKKINIVGSGLL